MTDNVGERYDAMAEQYAALFLGDLEGDQYVQDWLARFIDRALQQVGKVADLGCGPGHITNYLTQRGIDTVGYDISAGQIAQARKAFPELEYHVGDLAAIDCTDAAFGGIVSRYSIIHSPLDEHEAIFAEWMRVLEPGAPALVTFFGAKTADTHGMSFDHTVATAYALYPATVAEHMQQAGFVGTEIAAIPIPEGGRPFDQGTVLAHKPG